MKKLSKSVTLHYSPETMFQLVADIPTYQEFLPYCQASHMKDAGNNMVDGTLQVGYRGLHYTLVTRNQMVAPTHINVKLLEGPFKTLLGRWTFTSLPAGGCDIKLQIQYEFKNFLLSLTLERIMTPAMEMVMNAFIQRARELYGSNRG